MKRAKTAHSRPASGRLDPKSPAAKRLMRDRNPRMFMSPSDKIRSPDPQQVLRRKLASTTQAQQASLAQRFEEASKENTSPNSSPSPSGKASAKTGGSPMLTRSAKKAAKRANGTPKQAATA